MSETATMGNVETATATATATISTSLARERYPSLNEKQSFLYDRLTDKKRAFVDYRARGYNASESYKLAGYSGQKPNQGGYLIDHENGIADLINGIREYLRTVPRKNNRALEEKANEITDEQLRIKEMLQIKQSEQMTLAIGEMTPEQAKRVKFYQDICEGRVKTVKRTRKFDADHNLLGETVEEVSDLPTRIQARRELDKLFGLDLMLSKIGEVNAGSITINIVDASNKTEKADKTNEVVIPLDKTEYYDGEEVLVVEDEEKVEPKSKGKSNG